MVVWIVSETYYLITMAQSRLVWMEFRIAGEDVIRSNHALATPPSGYGRGNML